MGTGDVAAVLRRHGIHSSDDGADGRGAHPRLGVRGSPGRWSLATAPSHASAMEEADDAIDDFLTREVLDKLPRGVRDLVVRTSVAEMVAPGLARAILGRGSDAALDASLRHCGFVQGTCRTADSVATRCCGQPREVVLARAVGPCERGSPGRCVLVRRARRRRDGYPPRCGGRRLGLGGAHVRAVMGGAEHPARSRRGDRRRGRAGPRSRGGRAGADGRRRTGAPQRELAAAALARAAGGAAVRPPGSLPDRLSIAFVRLALARLEGDATTGPRLAAEVRDLTAQVPVARLVDEGLAPMVDAQLGALAVYGGDLDQASRLLTRGALGAGTSPLVLPLALTARVSSRSSRPTAATSAAPRTTRPNCWPRSPTAPPSVSCTPTWRWRGCIWRGARRRRPASTSLEPPCSRAPVRSRGSRSPTSWWRRACRCPPGRRKPRCSCWPRR